MAPQPAPAAPEPPVSGRWERDVRCKLLSVLTVQIPASSSLCVVLEVSFCPAFSAMIAPRLSTDPLRPLQPPLNWFQHVISSVKWAWHGFACARDGAAGSAGMRPRGHRCVPLRHNQGGPFHVAMFEVRRPAPGLPEPPALALALMLQSFSSHARPGLAPRSRRRSSWPRTSSSWTSRRRKSRRARRASSSTT